MQYLVHPIHRLKWAFLIQNFPLSVIVVNAVAVSFHIFIFNLQNYSWVKGIQDCSFEEPFFKVEVVKFHEQYFKTLPPEPLVKFQPIFPSQVFDSYTLISPLTGLTRVTLLSKSWDK